MPDECMDERAPCRAALGWGASIGTLIVLDVYTNSRHDESTLSSQLRRLYRTNTPAGRAAFIGSWAALTTWFIPHICRHPH